MFSNLLSLYLTDFYRLFDMNEELFWVDVLFWQTTEQSMAPQEETQNTNIYMTSRI